MAERLFLGSEARWGEVVASLMYTLFSVVREEKVRHLHMLQYLVKSIGR